MTATADLAQLAAQQRPEPVGGFVWTGAVFALLVLIIILWVIVTWGKLWVQALAGGAPVSWAHLIGWWLRRVNPSVMVEAHISAVQADVTVELADMERIYLVRRSGDDVRAVVNALIAAHKAGLAVSLPQLRGHHLVGGSLDNVLRGMVTAQRTGVPLDFVAACALDLTGEDVTAVIQAACTTPDGQDAPAEEG